MKKVALVALLLAIASVINGQDVPKESKLKFQGGIWLGTNGNTTLIGVPAAKLSGTFSVSKKTKLETGLMLIPGLITDKAGERLGLSAGGTVTVRKDSWKLKPVVGAVFVKTTTWQLLPGIGFVF